MRLLTKDVIADLWKREKENYPDLTYEEFTEICRHPVDFIKACIQSPTLPVIRIKYFGIFEVFPGKLDNLLRRIDNSLKKGRISVEKYNRLKKYYEELLEKIKPVTKVTLIDDTEDIITAKEIVFKPKLIKRYRRISAREVEI